MQTQNEKRKNVILAMLSVAILALSIAYAALSATLTINTQTTVKGNTNNWKIEFIKTATEEDASHMTCVATGNARIITQPTIISTSFTGLASELKTPGDSIVCRWNVENNGQIPAFLKTFTKPADNELTCTGTGDAKTQDENVVCSNIRYTLTYSTGEPITAGDSSTGDALNVNQDRGLILTIKYDENASALPTNDVTITGFDTAFLYEQK